MKIGLVSPNGQWGCLNLTVGRLTFCLGFVPGLFGIDLVWGNQFIIGQSLQGGRK